MIQKLRQPWKQELKTRQGITHTVVYHPTPQEIVDKINEIIEVVNALEEKQHTHKSDGWVYTSNPPQYKCKTCGAFFTNITNIEL